MDVTVYWKRVRLVPQDIWKFRVGNHLFSCSTLSIHKKRRPKRIFIGLAEYYKIRPTFYKDGEFMMNDKLVWRKLKGQS
jgi:hypothetical protein